MFTPQEDLFLSGEEQKKALEVELQQLKEKLVPTESAVVEAAKKLKQLQVKRSSEIFYRNRKTLVCLPS